MHIVWGGKNRFVGQPKVRNMHGCLCIHITIKTMNGQVLQVHILRLPNHFSQFGQQKFDL